MLRKTCFVGTVAAGAGLLASAPAMADTSDDDGVNIGGDNNLQLLPVQLCGADVIGKVVNQDSPDAVNCSNAPMVDHPKTEVHHHAAAPQPTHRAKPQGQVRERAAHHAKPQQHRAAAKPNLPTAPAPAPVSGHVPVTG